MILLYVVCFLIGYNLYLLFRSFDNLTIGAPDNLNELNTKLENAFNSENNGIYISAFINVMDSNYNPIGNEYTLSDDSPDINDIHTIQVDTSATLLNKNIVNGAYGEPGKKSPLPVGFFWDPNISQNASFAICGFEIDAATQYRFELIGSNFEYSRTHDKCGLLSEYTSPLKSGKTNYNTGCSSETDDGHYYITSPCSLYNQPGDNPSWKFRTDNRPPRFISNTKDNFYYYNNTSRKNPTEITSNMISLLKNNKSDIETVGTYKPEGYSETRFNFNEVVFYNSKISHYSNASISLENMLSEFSSNNISPAGYIQLIDATDKARWSMAWATDENMEQIKNIMKNADINSYLYIIKFGEDDNNHTKINEKKLVHLDELNFMDNIYGFYEHTLLPFLLKHGVVLGIIAGTCCLCVCINCIYDIPYRSGVNFILSKFRTTQDSDVPLLPITNSEGQGGSERSEESEGPGGSERRRRLSNYNCTPHIEEINLNWPLILSKINLVLPLSSINMCLNTISLRIINLMNDLNISTNKYSTQNTNNCNYKSNMCMVGGYNKFYINKSDDYTKNKLKRYMFDVADSFEDCITIYYNGTILTNNSFKIIVCFAKRADIPLQFIENLKTKQNKNELLTRLCEYYHIFVNDEINKSVFKKYNQCT